MTEAGAVLEKEVPELGRDADRIVEIDTGLIDPSPSQPRKFGKADEVKTRELSEGIRLSGQLAPIEVRKHPEKPGRFQLIYGERRVRACKLAGIKVEAVVVVKSDAEAMLSCFMENYAREDLTPLQEAAGFADLLKNYDPAVKTRKDLAELLGLNTMHVSRRMQLATLSKAWKKRFSDPDSAYFQWGASLMEYVAKFPPAMQDEIAKGINVWEVPGMTLTHLRNAVSRACHELSSAPWKKDDALLCPKAGACTECPKRSSCDPDLFDAADFASNGRGKAKGGVGDRCLDKGCYESKHEAWVAARKSKVLAEHPKAVLVTSDWEKRGKKKLVYHHDMDSCKKSAAGAKPVFHVDGSKAGEFEWMKPYNSGASSSANGSTKSDRPKTLAERKKPYLKRRRVAVFDAMLLALEEARKDIGSFKHLGWGDLLAFAAVMGAQDSALLNQRDKGEAWADYEKTRKLASKDDTAVIGRLFLASLDVLETRFRNGMHNADHDLRTEMEYGCTILNLKLKDLEAAALAEIPDPKSWANLKTDGTSKTAAKPAKAKAKGKSESKAPAKKAA